MKKKLIASLFLVTSASACHGVIEVEGTPSGQGGSSAGGSSSGGTATGGSAGSSPFTGTGNEGGGGATGTSTTSDSTTSGSTTSDSTTSSSMTAPGPFCLPEGGAPSGAIVAASVLSPSLSVWSMTVDLSGNLILAGVFTGTPTLGGAVLSQVGGFNPSSPDVFLAKLDPCGQPLWVRSYGTPGYDLVRGLDTTPSGDVLLVREVQSAHGARILKLDSSGQEIWERVAENFNVAGMHGIARAPDGGSVLVGQIWGTFDMGNGPITGSPTDGIVVRLDANGQALWTVWADFPVAVGTVDAVVTPQGETLVTGVAQKGFYGVKLGTTGQALWTYATTGGGTVDSIKLSADAGGNLYVGGRYFWDVDFGLGNPNTFGKAAAFALSLSPQGDVAWVDAMVPVDQWSQIWDPQVLVKADGTAMLVGNYHGVYDVAGAGSLPDPGNGDVVGPISMYFAGLGAGGTLDWLATNGTLSSPWLSDAALVPDGSAWIAQTFTGSLVLADGTTLQQSPVLLHVAP